LDKVIKKLIENQWSIILEGGFKDDNKNLI
jgi:hypothetical protein